MFRWSRREIIEELMRQGVHGLSRIKLECRWVGHFWEVRMSGIVC